jgi:hypothetical protein
MKKSAREQNSNKRTIRKDRLEKWITDVLNGEDNSKIKQISKEAVKAVLSEYKKLISISLTAIIQILKDDPELVNLIHNMLIPKVNGHNDNNDINIIKYLGFNKDNLLDLAEKNYQNLVEE